MNAKVSFFSNITRKEKKRVCEKLSDALDNIGVSIEQSVELFNVRK